MLFVSGFRLHGLAEDKEKLASSCISSCTPIGRKNEFQYSKYVVLALYAGEITQIYQGFKLSVYKSQEDFVIFL